MYYIDFIYTWLNYNDVNIIDGIYIGNGKSKYGGLNGRGSDIKTPGVARLFE